jgi:hypothetical protein
VVEVVGEADTHAAIYGRDERVPDDVRGRACQAEVVEREVEPLLRGTDEGGNGMRDLVCGLTPVGQEPQLEAVTRRDYPCSALRFAL